MKRLQLAPGRVAVSLAGRDEGRRFVVIEEIDEKYVFIADGKLRGVDRPKRKKRMHLKATVSMMDMPDGRKPTDAEIRSALCVNPEKEG